MPLNKNLSSRTTFARDASWLQSFLMGLFIPLESMGVILIEAFIRTGFGERYFRRAAAVRTVIFFGVLPILHLTVMAEVTALYGVGTPQDFMFSNNDTVPVRDDHLWVCYIGWYLYLAAFMVMAQRHHKEIKSNRPALDGHYSLARGNIHEKLYEVSETYFNKEDHSRFISCWLEPAPFFIAGLLFLLIGQYLGWLLIFCSITYSVSYHMAYMEGDETIMNTIDLMIKNKYLKQVFVDDADPSETKGFSWTGRKPGNPKLRKEVYDWLKDDDGRKRFVQ